MAPALRSLARRARFEDVEGLRALAAELGTTLPDTPANTPAPKQEATLEHALVRAIEGREAAQQQARRARHAEAATGAAVELARAALPVGDRWELPPGLLLGPLLSDQTRRLVALVLPGDRVIAIHRRKLLECRRFLLRLAGLRAYVDEQGLHFRWKEGRGGLDLLPQPLVLPRDLATTELVVLHASGGAPPQSPQPAEQLRALRPPEHPPLRESAEPPHSSQSPQACELPRDVELRELPDLGVVPEAHAATASPMPEPSTRRPNLSPPRPSAGNWLRDILAELGF